MNGVQTRFKCKLDVKRCKRFVFPPSSLLPRSNALKTKAIRYFQTDRTLTRIVSPPLYADYTQQPKADFILITHEHGDHFDTKAIAAIETNQTKIIANPNCRKKLNRGQEMKNGDVLQLAKDIKLEAVPAYNTTPGRDKFHPKGRDNGYILTLGGTRIYIAGDTEDIPELNQVKDIDIAFLPVNQPYTMTPEQAIRAAKIIKPRVLYPYHYGETDIHKVKDGLKNETGTEVRIRALQ